MNCKKCGELLRENAGFCGNCGTPVQHEPVEQSFAEEQPVQQNTAEPEAAASQPAEPAGKPENVFTGIVGALIGAALGAGAIILLSQLGFVASISGFILAVCTLKGYELLGNRLSVKGIIICIVLMLVTPYLADRLDWAIVIMQAYTDEGVTLGQAFAVVPMFLEDGAIEMTDYIKSLAMVYGFTALGAFSTVASALKKKK